MKIDGWKYYNHAVIPTTAPHEEPDTTPILDGSVWKDVGEKAFLARWTTDFDCGYETEWWWIIKDAPYNIDALSSSSRKHIKQALKKCYVKRVNPENYRDELWDVFDSAYARYKNSTNSQNENAFKSGLKQIDGVDYWAGFDCETNLMIGYMTCVEHETYVIAQTAKYIPSYMNRGSSAAIYHYVLQYYLNEKKKKYVCGGERTIYHITNTQDYKIQKFGYRKAYCRLHIVYRKPVGLLIRILMPIRKILYKFNRVGIISKINGILRMEEICRSQNKKVISE